MKMKQLKETRRLWQNGCETWTRGVGTGAFSKEGETPLMVSPWGKNWRQLNMEVKSCKNWMRVPHVTMTRMWG